VSTKNRKSIAGMSLGGGRKENFFFSLLEYYPEEDRWFLTSLKQVKDEDTLDRDEVITNWVNDDQLHQLVVDFPLTKPVCATCSLDCPGIQKCYHPVMIKVQDEIEELIEVDKRLVKENPKRYEQERVDDNMVHYNRSVLHKKTTDHILSKSFKRKLKKGFVPYWNRPLDFWIWKNYYDQILKTFNVSFDSYGNVSLMLMNRFHYLLRHLPKELSLFESDIRITLLELYRSKIISKKHLLELNDINVATLTRVQIARQIEKKCKIFLYEKDLELISKNPKAFDSFILSVAGMQHVKNQTRKVDDYGEKDPAKFIVPAF
jgi:hypothetical protein